MGSFRVRIIAVANEVFLRDQARLVEWMNVLLLGVWVQFLLARPDEFLLPRYAAFHALAPGVWALLFMSMIIAQLISMRLQGWKWAPVLRAFAMMMAGGVWAVIAVNFWQTDTAPISARTTTVLALSFMATGVYLGLVPRR